MIGMCLQLQMAYAQSTEDCKDLVYEIYHTPKPQENRVYYADYSVKMVERKAGKAAVENKVKIYADKSHKQLLTSMVQMFSDDKFSITLMPQSRMITINTISDKVKEELKKMDPASSDSLFFAALTVESCKAVSTSDHYTKEVILKPLQKGGAIKKIKYLVDEQKKQMYKVFMYYPDGSPYHYAEYTYYKVDYNYTEKKIDQPVYELFFKKDGTLLSKYKGYSVIDNRPSGNNKIKK
jgi:hypothetical protein